MPPLTPRVADSLAILVFFAVAVLLVFPALTHPQDRIPAAALTDGQTQFVPWRVFGFGELARGHVPLWNPYAFCGTPFVGNLQSALFYPPNALHLAFGEGRVGRAITVIVAFHLALAGVCAYAWCRHTGASRLASALGGVVYSCCGPVFLHLVPGHLSWIAVVAWSPLVLVAAARAADAASPSRGAGWAALGACGVGMQLLAGHPQPVYLLALAGAVHLVLRARGVRAIARALAGWVAIHGVGALIAGVQLGPAISMLAETGRAERTPGDFATAHALPPANLWLYVVPRVFGDGLVEPYAGASYPWEVTPYFGALALALACVGALVREPAGVRNPASSTRHHAPLGLVALILAFGAATPLHGLACRWIPLYDRFRAPARWCWILALLALPLVARGVDVLPRAGRRLAIGLAGAAALVLAAILDPAGVISTALSRAPWSAFAARELHLAFGFLATGALLALGSRHRLAAVAFAVLAAAEPLRCALATRTSAESFPARPAAWSAGLASPSPRDARALYVESPYLNAGLVDRVPSAWGYDPLMLARTAALVARAQGASDSGALEATRFERVPPGLAILRIAHVLRGRPGDAGVVVPAPPTAAPLPRFALVGRYALVASPEDAYAAVLAPGFDPREVVVLESAPELEPAGRTGTWAILEESMDRVVVEVQLPRAALLLMTDAYSRDWVARALAPGPQAAYRVMPANGALRAIPLAAGSHTIEIAYEPAGWWWGIRATGAGVATFVALAWWSRRAAREWRIVGRALESRA